MSRQARIMVNNLLSIESYFKGNVPMKRELVDNRIKYLYDHLGSWVDLKDSPVVSYQLSVLNDFARGDRMNYIGSYAQASTNLAARCIPIIKHLAGLE